MSALISFIVFLVMTFIGFPVAVSLGACTLLFAALLDVPLTVLAQSAYTGIDSFTYIAIPLFILVGNLMETGGLSKRLVGFASSLLIKFPGKLGSIMVAACAFFGAISGSASATTASIGGMMVPEMINRKYSRGYSGALAAVAGTLGAMIPPSIVMIIYALAAEVSVTDMFTAGLIPGIVMAISLMIANTVYAFVAKVDIATGQDKFSIKAVGRSFWDAKWALLTPVIILGGIYSGIFTATECAVIATVYAFIVGKFIYGELSWKDTITALVKTCKTVGSILIIVAMAIALGKLLTISQTTNAIQEFILARTSNANVIMLIIIGIVFIAGMFIDSAPIILIITPLFLPILTSMGVSPIHFGIVMTLGCMMANVTPPVGINLYIAMGIANVDIVTIMKYTVPLIIVFMVTYVIIMFIPGISLFLPNMLA